MNEIELELQNLKRAALRKYLFEETTIDWEQRHYEIARDVLAKSFAANKHYRGMDIKDMVKEAIEAADALVAGLKALEL